MKLSQSQHEALRRISKCPEEWSWEATPMLTLTSLVRLGLIELKATESYTYKRTRTAFGMRCNRTHVGHDVGARLTKAGRDVLGGKE